MSTTYAELATAFDGVESTGALAPQTATPIDREIWTWTNEIFSAQGGGTSVGFWQATVDRSRWVFEDYSEAIVVLEGRLTVTEDGDEPRDLGPGDVAVSPAGWSGEWNITENLRKFYAVFP